MASRRASQPALLLGATGEQRREAAPMALGGDRLAASSSALNAGSVSGSGFGSGWASWPDNSLAWLRAFILVGATERFRRCELGYRVFAY